MSQMNKSPTRWKTEQRDNFRYFVDSPAKIIQNEESQGGVHVFNSIEQRQNTDDAELVGHESIEDNRI